MHHRPATVCIAQKNNHVSSKIPLHDAGDKVHYFACIAIKDNKFYQLIIIIAHLIYLQKTRILLERLCVCERETESERDDVSGKMRTKKS